MAAVRRCRRRKAAGLAILQVEVPLGPLADQLAEDGFLPAWDTEDRAAVETALRKMLAAYAGVTG